MKSLVFDKGKLSSAVLSACLAGGVVIYSTTVNTATGDVGEGRAEAKTHLQTKTTQGENGDGSTPSFDQVDQNRSSTLSWRELRAIYRDELDEAGWNETYVLETYDQEGNAALSEDEYIVFTSGLMSALEKQPKSRPDSGAITEVYDEQSSAESGDESQRRHEAATSTDGVRALAEHSNDEILRRKVINPTGDALGDVRQVVSAPDGSITGLVIGVGGFWKIGKKNVFAPLDEVHVVGDYIIWRTTLDEYKLKNIPHYPIDEYSDLAH